MKMFFGKLAYASALMLSVGSVSLFAVSGQAIAQTAKPAVRLSSVAMIERIETDATGQTKTALHKPSDVVVVPGDIVIFTLSYNNTTNQPATGFSATNPMPGPIQFINAAEDWAEVSVDGAKSWGKLSDLKVTDTPSETMNTEEAGDPATKSAPAPSIRAATPADVTAVRWVFANAIAPGQTGNLTFRGVVK
jgi:uncharacterized repeat protein (TIGR01451 family)